ncbi:MAG: hypothetical protein ACR2PT_13165 [Endozoicomonas sp.]
MNTLTLESWCKPNGEEFSSPIGSIHFRVNEDCRLLLEKAQEALQTTHEPEAFVPIDMSTMELETPSECGLLSDCQLRVYLRPVDNRGQFHLVAHRAMDDSLIYSNAVMVDQLG